MNCIYPLNDFKDTSNPIVLSVVYEDDDKESIFGNLDEEEIRNIIDKLLIELENEDAETDKIIEEVFKESGIENPSQIEAAKTRLTFSSNE